MSDYCEPTLADVLSDPLTRAVMDADGVNPRELETMLTKLARDLSVRHTPVMNRGFLRLPARSEAPALVESDLVVQEATDPRVAIATAVNTHIAAVPSKS
jgi:hypothetical protein